MARNVSRRDAAGPAHGGPAHGGPAGDDLARLPNLGPASAALLRAAGVPDAATLRALGAAAAFRRVLFARGGRASRNLLWALEGALTGRRWDRLDAAAKARLLREVERDDA